MQYWTKNGSIPCTETDGTEGWQQAPAPPADVPQDKELVWLNWEWMIRDPKPVDRLGWQWNWRHDDKTWVESAWHNQAGQHLEVASETTVIENVENT